MQPQIKITLGHPMITFIASIFLQPLKLPLDHLTVSMALWFPRNTNHLVEHVEKVNSRIFNGKTLDESSKIVSLHLPSNNPSWFTKASFSVNLDMEFLLLWQHDSNEKVLDSLCHCRNTELYLCAPLHEQKRSLEWVIFSRLRQTGAVAKRGKNSAYTHMVHTSREG